MARIEHGTSMHYQSRHDRNFQAVPTMARVQFGTEADQGVAMNSDGVMPDEPTELALDVPKNFSIKHASHKFGSVLAGNAIFASSKDADANDGGCGDSTPATPSNRWHVAPFPIRIAIEEPGHEGGGSGSGTAASPSGGAARSKGQAGGTRSVTQLPLAGLAEANRHHGGAAAAAAAGLDGADGGGEGSVEEQEPAGPHSDLVDRAEEALNTARSNRNRRGSLDDGTGADPGSSSFNRPPEPVYAKSATKFVANLAAAADGSDGGGGGAVVGRRKHVDVNSRDAWVAAAAAAGVQVSGGSFSSAAGTGGCGLRAPPARRASQVSYGDGAGAAGHAPGEGQHVTSDAVPAGARFMVPAPPPPRTASRGLGAVSSNSRRSSVVGEPVPGVDLLGGGSGSIPSGSHSRLLSRGPSALSMTIPEPAAGPVARDLEHGHSWKQQQHQPHQQQQRSEATYGGAGIIGGISTEQEAAQALGLLAKVAHTDLRPAAPQLWAVDPSQAPGVAALSAAAAASATGGAGAVPSKAAAPPAARHSPSRTPSSAAISVSRRLSSSALGLLGIRVHRSTLDGDAEPASSAGSVTSAAGVGGGAGDVASGAHSRIAARRSSITDGLGGPSGGAGQDEDAEFLAAQAAALAEFGGALRTGTSRTSLLSGGLAPAGLGAPAGGPVGGPLRGGPAAPRAPRGAPPRNASCIGTMSTTMAMPGGGGGDGSCAGAAADAPRPAARRRGSIDESLLIQQRGGGSVMDGRRRSMEEAQQMSRVVPATACAAAALAAGSGSAVSHGQLSSGMLPAVGSGYVGSVSSSQQRLPSILSAPAPAEGSHYAGAGRASLGGGGGAGSTSSSQARLQQQLLLQAQHSSSHQLHHYPGHCNLVTPDPNAILPGHHNPYANKGVIAFGGGGDDAVEAAAAAAHARHERFAHLPTPAALPHDASAAVAMRGGGGGGGVLAAPPPAAPVAGGRRLSASFISAYAGLGGDASGGGGSHMTRESLNPLADVTPADLGAINSNGVSGGGGAAARVSVGGNRRSSGEFQRPHAPPPTQPHGSLATHVGAQYGMHHASDGGGSGIAAEAAAGGDLGSGDGGAGAAGAVEGEGVLRKLRGAFSGLLHKGDSKGHGQSRSDY
ncbi:hypothetical protein HYH02_013163 [Chlamydomonas schloesseri]|uniref:Uncharacterized protein n=1 Tax=Chlamydomonas schloesseri TaxID=2026947 RepID=A0A835T586_9CHLO|nr:hypothetical protein HYH02_013163 [Chlamydomonas schloesseri]|eukprot:KAG2431945.1 hypothetical protein HYH02_013163 [Chlamydomonas schloesseri]